jgi:nucleoside phosphorylase/tetratricopeptide (TPR) repeat protein
VRDEESAHVAARAAALAARVTFVLVTALPKEYAAMKAMLDEPVSFRAPGRGATHDYLLGEVPERGGGKHAVALVLADQGNPGAATYVTSAVHDFTDLNAVIMVGIAGAVPHPAKVEDHVRLGDVVVSGGNGVAKYDFVKEHRDRIESKSPPRPPSASLLNAARRLEAGALEGKRPWEDHLGRAAHLNVMRPDAKTDLLAETADPSRWVVHPHDPDRRPDAPRVFLGTIASADRLQRNAAHRDALREQYGARAVEMEGAGVAEAAWLLECFYFVVRGACDYCDANKNDAWQPYAAVIAAAYTLALLEETAAVEPGVSARSSGPAPLTGDPALDPATQPARAVVGRQRTTALSVGIVDRDPILEAEHHAHLDGARDLLRKGHARLASDDLEALKARIWSSAAPAVRARVLGLIGHAEFELGHFEAAGKALVGALDHAPLEPKVQANAALGHSLLGNTAAASQWAHTALESDPTNVTARQVLIHHDGRDDATILEEHEKILGTRAELFFALGHRASRSEDPARAAHWFRKAAAVDAADPEVLASVGQSLLGVVLEKLDETLEPKELTAADRERLREAADYLQRAWGALKDDEVRGARVHWALSLGNARRLLDEHLAAVAVADEALRLGGAGTQDVVGFRAAVATDAKDYKRVVELLDGRTNETPEALGLLAAAKSNLADYDAAVELWKKLLNLDLSDSGREQAERNLVLTLLEAGKGADAHATVARLLEEDATIPRQLIASEVAGRLGDTALRDERLQGALGRATRETPRRLLLSLGDALLRAARPEDAASVYELCTSPETSERDANRLLTALHRAGRFASALEACRRITESRGPTRLCTEVESVIHEQLGDLPSARAACERYLKDHAEDSAVLLRLATILQRAGERAAEEAVLDRIRPNEILDDLVLGAHLIELLVAAGRKTAALDLLYALRRAHIDDPRAHLLYISRHLVLGREDRTPDVVGIDVAARIEGAGAPADLVLVTDDANPDRSQGELGATQPLAKAMLGKRVGDAVTFESAPHRQWRIAELCSKYAFAHRKSLAEFGARFPDDASLEQYDVPKDPGEFVSQLKARLGESAPQWDKILDAYGSTSVTVGALGKALGRSPREALGIVLVSRHGLIAAANTTEEKQAASVLLDRADSTLVLDFTALVVLDAIDVLESATMGRPVIVAQTTVDVLRQEVARWRDVPDDGYMSMGVHEGELLRHVFSNTDVARARERLEHLLAWIRDHFQVVPVSAAAVERHADKRELPKLIGECFSDSLLLASEERRILVSDDLKLRFLARQLFGADGIASVHLLLAQRAVGRLDAQTAATACMKLVVSNYRHVAVDATVLEAAARAEQWHPTGAFARVVDTLKGPDTQLQSAIIVAVEFLRIVWFALVLPQQRDGLVMAVLDALAVGRNQKEVLDIVRIAVRAKFVLLPLAAKDFERVLNLWARMHLQG